MERKQLPGMLPAVNASPNSSDNPERSNQCEQSGLKDGLCFLSRPRGQVLPRHFLRCGPFDHLQAEGMKEPPGFFGHGGEKLKKTVPLPVIFKGPAPKVAWQDLTPLPTHAEVHMRERAWLKLDVYQADFWTCPEWR